MGINGQNRGNTRVVIAMSGGVDSSVAAGLLVQQGFDVIGIMMRLWSESVASRSSTANRCCTPDQMADARRVADHLGIPFYVVDAQSQFRTAIVQHYIDEHQAGRTPNPCIACNRQIRFSYLLNHAQALGAQFLATGHYAQVRRSEGFYELLRGSDPNKDQSYVLYTLNQEKLANVLFPVGGYNKEHVRELAEEFGLPVATKHDSQDLCFVVDGDHKGFLQRHSEGAFIPGPIVDQNGIELGHHDGLPFYTIGQRKGLGVSADRPLYVLNKDNTRNAIVVGPRDALDQESFRVRDLNWISGLPIPSKQQIGIKIRYKAETVPGHVLWEDNEDNSEATIKINDPVSGVTPGQGAVFYDEDVCLGGGIISDPEQNSIAENLLSSTRSEEW